MALTLALCLLLTLPHGLGNKHLRACIAQLLGIDPANYKPGSMTYDLRRLRLHGLIERVPGTFRYFVTEKGVRVSAFYSKVYARILRPALSIEPIPHSLGKLRAVPIRESKGLNDIEKGLDRLLTEARILA